MSNQPKPSKLPPIPIALLGATGAVGREALQILEQRRHPAALLRLFASPRSAGKRLPYAGELLPVEPATEKTLSDAAAPLVLGMTDAAVSRRFAPIVQRYGGIFVDNSSAFRGDPAVPLLIPTVNAADAEQHGGILSVPNCTTVISLCAVAPIHRLSPVECILASSYQAVSGSGEKGIRQLREELPYAARGETLPEPDADAAYPYPIVGNLLPFIGTPGEGGFTGEEWKMQREARKILHLPTLKVNCTCVRVPVLRCHSVSLTLRTKDPVPLAAVREALSAAPGVQLWDDPENRRYPMPLFCAGQDDVFVGRLRTDPTDPRGITLFCCGDQLRRGAAATAVEIGELVMAAR